MGHPESDETLEDSTKPVLLDYLNITRGRPLNLDGLDTGSDIFTSIQIGRLPRRDDVENFYIKGSIQMDFRDGLCAGQSIEVADTYLAAHKSDIRIYLRDRYGAKLDAGTSWEDTSATFETELPTDARTDQVLQSLESETQAVELQGDVDLSYKFYDALRVSLERLDIRRNAAAAPRSVVPVFARTNEGNFSQTVELRTALGLLHDAPDGTPAYRHQKLNGTTLQEARYTAGVNCDSPLGEPSVRVLRPDGTVRGVLRRNAAGKKSDLPDGTPARREYVGDDQHVRVEMRYHNGVMTDAADGTPCSRQFHDDGSVATTTTAAGKWTQGRPGKVAVHIDPRNGQAVHTAGLNGGQLTFRVDAAGELHNGPGGSPASTACRTNGTIQTTSFYEHGVLIRTVDYAPDGSVEADFGPYRTGLSVAR